MELDDLYQEVILDHYRHPRHFAEVSEAEALVDEENPLCGDHIRLVARLEAGRLQDVRVSCQGCAICTASASMMAEVVSGQWVEDVQRQAKKFLVILRGEQTAQAEELGDLLALGGVSRFPMRVKCATMPWHALQALLARLAANKPKPSDAPA